MCNTAMERKFCQLFEGSIQKNPKIYSMERNLHISGEWQKWHYKTITQYW